MSERFVFTGIEELRERVISALDEAEKGARARTLPRDGLEEIFEAVAARRWGLARGNGGHAAKSYRYRAETTEFALAWYTWRGEKHIYLSATRGAADKVAYGSLGGLALQESREKAYEFVFPGRAQRLRKILNQRAIARATRHLPPLPAGVGEIIAAYPDAGGLAVVKTSRYIILIGTPSGWLRAPRHKDRENRPAWNYLAALGFPVPRRKKDRVWNDELAAYAAMHVLGGE